MESSAGKSIHSSMEVSSALVLINIRTQIYIITIANKLPTIKPEKYDEIGFHSVMIRATIPTIIYITKKCIEFENSSFTHRN
jgi:hypothetical protein